MNGNSLMFGVDSGPYGSGRMIINISIRFMRFGIPMAVLMKHRCDWTAMVLNGDQL